MAASKSVELWRALLFEPLQRRVPTPGRRILALVYLAGIAGLLWDSRPGQSRSPGVDFPIVFGALLWIMVLVAFSERAHAAERLRRVALREFCRQLARAVYLLLYVLFGLNLLIAAGSQLWIHGSVQPVIPQAYEGMRAYLACGVLALIAIRVRASLGRLADDQYHE